MILPMHPLRFSIVDVETTGSNIQNDRIIEIAILTAENNKIINTFQTLLNPGIFISPFIQELTGIKKEELEEAPTFFELKDKIYDLLNDSIFVAHNARFDYGFIKSELRTYNISYSAKQLCTVKLSRLLYPYFRSHNLDSLISRFGFRCEKRHRAFDDASALWEFMKHIRQTFPSVIIDQTLNKILKKPSLPTHLKEEAIANLPESPGVYIFYGESETPLYIGKSVNVKDRVLSHFSSDINSSSEMQLKSEVRNIEVIQTAGELGALFTESNLIKKLQPLHNKKLRYAYKIFVLRKITEANGFDTVKLEALSQINIEEAGTIMAVFKSKKQAKDFLFKTVKEFNLCESLLGIAKSKGPCFSYHLGYCLGACAKKEQPIRYNIRFLSAFIQTRIKTWPFSGPIIITEKREFDGSAESFIVDKWCLLGKVSFDEFGEKSELHNYVFDLDMYKILVRFVMDAKNSHRIKHVNPKSYQVLFANP